MFVIDGHKTHLWLVLSPTPQKHTWLFAIRPSPFYSGFLWCLFSHFTLFPSFYSIPVLTWDTEFPFHWIPDLKRLLSAIISHPLLSFCHSCGQECYVTKCNSETFRFVIGKGNKVTSYLRLTITLKLRTKAGGGGVCDWIQGGVISSVEWYGTQSEHPRVMLPSMHTFHAGWVAGKEL